MMTSDERPAKRARSSEPEAANPSQTSLAVTRSADFWFGDGSVVLQSSARDNLPVATQYRVHKSVLTKHSKIFEDMFSFPQPAEQDLVEGCPVVTLTEYEEEIKIVLDALYGSYINKPVLPISAIQAMLSLGKKYFLVDLRREAVRRLRNDFGSDLKTWNLDDSFRTIDWTGVDLFDLATFAYTEDIHIILPHILTKYLEQSKIDQILSDAMEKVDSHTLRLKLQLLCSRAFFRMLKAQRNNMHWLPDEPNDRSETWDPSLPIIDCSDTKRCKNGLAGMRGEVCALLDVKLVGLDEWNESWDGILCGPCASWAKESMGKARTDFWRRLPYFYGFKSWESLKKDCKTMLE